MTVDPKEFEELQELLFNPKGYREAFKYNSDEGEQGEIFELLKHQIAEYAENNTKFREFILNNVEVKSSSVAFSPDTIRHTPSIPSQNFSPRVRISSKPDWPRSSSRPTLN